MIEYEYNYIYAEDGKRLLEGDKDSGVMVMLPSFKDPSVFKNVKEIKLVKSIMAEEGKILVRKETNEQMFSVDFIDGDSKENYEEIELEVEEEERA
jgi:hypothetical protein